MLKISVVIPTHNRSGSLRQTIASLTEQEGRATEIIVVDNCSTDDTESVVDELKGAVKRLRYVFEPQLGASYARNRGAAEASCEMVAFIDDDSVASWRWLAAISDAARESPAAAAIAGPIGLRWSRQAPTWLRGLEGWYGRFDLGAERTTIDYPCYPFASNVAFRRESLLSIGGFPVKLGPRGTQLLTNEENGLFRRVADRGWTVVYEPRARIFHWVHSERLSRRYLLHRSLVNGKSEVMADSLFTNSRPLHQRALKVFQAGAGTLSAARITLTRRDGNTMHAGVATAAGLGRTIEEARLLVSAASRRTAKSDDPSDTGLTAEQIDHFDKFGYIRVSRSFQGADAMADRLWTFFARRGIKKDDPQTWPTGFARHMQKLLREADFMPIGGDGTTCAIDSLLGAGQWSRPNHWGEFLVTFPEPGRSWTVPTLWHSDAAYSDPLRPLSGAVVFSFINRVEHQGGGTLALAGSHRLIARFAAGRPAVANESTAVARKAFYRSHPWLAELITPSDDTSRYRHFSQLADVDGISARVVELTGDPGDIVIMHPLLAHCISPNCASQPRFMRVARPAILG